MICITNLIVLKSKKIKEKTHLNTELYLAKLIITYRKNTQKTSKRIINTVRDIEQKSIVNA